MFHEFTSDTTLTDHAIDNHRAQLPAAALGQRKLAARVIRNRERLADREAFLAFCAEQPRQPMGELCPT